MILFIVIVRVFFDSGTHVLYIENATDARVDVIVFFTDGATTKLISIVPNGNTKLRKTVYGDGSSEIFIRQNKKWYHQQVNDYMCRGVTSDGSFVIQEQDVNDSICPHEIIQTKDTK
jgi:hypothetical protein